ncbi:MAG: DUF89 family protein [Candidatus Omnitrophota bacterium]|nr:MAG: DUF89 family protein [Candidatus Omnitrophota bacterium]
MKTSPQCVECFFRQIAKATSGLRLSRRKKAKAFAILTHELLQFDFNQPPVVFGRTIYKTISKLSGIQDIFAKEKMRIEKHLLKFYSDVEQILHNAKDPLYTAAKLCCAANAIDFGAGKSPDLEKLFSQMRKVHLAINHFHTFRDTLKRAKTILFIGDNCGEAFFDRVFIEELLKYKPTLKIFYATRSSPIINDILIADAKRIGLQEVAGVISSGCDYPGLILAKTSSRFQKIYRKADIVVSKGQGNFESLEDIKKDIFYIFKIKCPTVSDFLRIRLHSLLFLYNKNKYMV